MSQGDLVIPLPSSNIVSRRHLVMNESLEDLQLTDMWEGYDVSDEDWNDYYNAEEYDDNSWEDLGGVNADHM